MSSFNRPLSTATPHHVLVQPPTPDSNTTACPRSTARTRQQSQTDCLSANPRHAEQVLAVMALICMYVLGRTGARRGGAYLLVHVCRTGARRHGAYLRYVEQALAVVALT